MNRIKNLLQSEKSIQDSILKYLRSNYPKAVTFKIHEDPVFGTCGLPDIFFAYDGDVFFFEVKKPGESLTPLQNIMIKKLRENLVLAFRVTSVKEVEDLLKGTAT